MYATELTKAYLKSLGITKVSEDGKHIYKGKEEVTQRKHNDGYLRVTLFDKKLYKIEYPKTKSHGAGSVTIGVHRLVYAWFHGSAKADYVVDHIDDNKTNNELSNLQLLTPKENIWKGREHDVKEIKCKLSRPRSYYEDKLNTYLTWYELAKREKDADLVHKLRTNISQTRARLRYWDSHNGN